MQPHPIADGLATWIVIFNPKSKSRLANWLSIGRFKHVSAMAYVAGIESWVTYDVAFARNSISVIPNRLIPVMTDWVDGCTLVKIERRPERKRLFPPLFGWCAPSIAQLLGLPRRSLQVTALYRQCLANGGVVLNEPISPPIAG